MQLFDSIMDSDLDPAAAVAMDEDLLDRAENGRLSECLRLWTAHDYFVVLGTNGKIEKECHEELCARDGVPVLKRRSGGGTVLMGPGCLAWSVILDHAANPRLADVRGSYQAILGRIVDALARRGVAAHVACCADLAIGDRKFGGNAQFRRRRFLLHHGTILCAFDLARIGLYLKHPPREPAYRLGRGHGDFLINLPLSVDQTAAALRDAFDAPAPAAFIKNQL